ncbi:MAG: gliding motility-associated C-terminal domain-containing protein [Fluviicola sp.]|nr:gliding motility-associated C-terminal domain-containing protein [Fluviicola sp.]
MRVFISCISVLFSFFGFAQDRVFSCGNNGEIIEFNNQTCSARSLGVYDVFGDIAVTQNGEIYGIIDRLYRIDTISQISVAISPVLISNIGGLGLLALDNNTLLYDKSDSLFLYDLTTNIESLLGVVGYGTNGDFAMFEGLIYMISNNNELIRIELDSSNTSIQTITNIGVLGNISFNPYGIFTTYINCTSSLRRLFLIDGKTIYSVNETNAQVEEICTLQNQEISFGAATLYGSDNGSFTGIIPNVFTPNGDGVNDEYRIDSTDNISLFQIINRWGNVVYSWSSGVLNWDGKDVSEGVYFYRIQYISCSEELTKTGHITLLK